MNETNKDTPRANNKIWSFLGFLVLAIAIGVILMNEFDAWALNLGTMLAIASLPLIFWIKYKKGATIFLKQKLE